MADISNSRPAWQTDDLDEEWIEQDASDDNSVAFQSISFTEPLPTFLQTSSNQSQNDQQRPRSVSPAASEAAIGTFLIREDMPAASLLPKTPGRDKKAGMKDIFSPLALERMFDPPSPPAARRSTSNAYQPAVRSRLSNAFDPTKQSDESSQSYSNHLQVPTANAAASATPKPSIPNGQFTFSVPHRPMTARRAPSTPNQDVFGPKPPASDSRLRLFQFQYDTFTREQLSAIVDSIAVTPSGESGEASRSPSLIIRPNRLSKVSEASEDAPSRSVKRVRLSPASDYGEGDGAGAIITRPDARRKDYVGESRSLMQQIKQARDFSAISVTPGPTTPAIHARTPRDARRGPHTNTPHPQPLSSSRTSSSDTPGSNSSLAYRQEAATLMEQIKNDIKGPKRSLSSETQYSAPSRANHSNGSVSTDEKENRSLRKWSHASLGRRGSPRASPKKNGARRTSARYRQNPDDSEHRLVQDMSNMSIEAPFPTELSVHRPLDNAIVPDIRITAHSRTNSEVEPAEPPPQPPQSLVHFAIHAPSYPSLRSGTNVDLNRFVSSSTASGTATMASSVPSFVKHPGPVQMTRIAPSDLPSLPDRVGKMVYDKELMKWVKVPAGDSSMHPVPDNGRDQTAVTDPESEDPFRDIESFEHDSRDSRSLNDSGVAPEEDEEEKEELADMSRIEEVEEDEEQGDPEEVDLASFSFDANSFAGLEIPSPDEATEVTDDQTTDSDSDGDTMEPAPVQVVFDSEDEASMAQIPQATIPSTPAPSARRHLHFNDTPVPLPPGGKYATVSGTPMPTRSALKSGSTTPVSALKDPNRDRYRTPMQHRTNRRSVSFSDGKRDGPIRGLTSQPVDSESSASDHTATQSFVPSARTQRITNMMQELESSAGGAQDECGSPTKSAYVQKPTPLVDFIEDDASGIGQDILPAELTGAPCLPNLSSLKRDRPADDHANATFLTEWSFGVAHDRLVQVITDIQPFEPYWEELTFIDLSKRALDSVARLKEFLPQLDRLSLNSNQLSWLSGIPSSVRTLSVASNVLTSVTSFSHLVNLESLDISHNDIDSLKQLQCLRHLRELRADGNKIDSLAGLEKMNGLVKLSLQGNQLQEVDFTRFAWSRLEMLNLSRNKITGLLGLSSNLPSLISLNVDNNALNHLDPGGPMPRLRILRVSGNRLQQLNASLFPNLRTLYADNNSLGTLTKAERLTKLENLSMRNQGCRELHLPTRQFRDVKRLYLSGNKLKTEFIAEPCYNLVYLEVAACRLTSLPRDLAKLAPNLRVLNLNYNFLEDAQPLEGLTRLKKLTLIGSRLKGTKSLIRVLQRMPDAEMLDFRMNPCTLGWYLPLLVKDVPGALQPSESGGGIAAKAERARSGEKERGEGSRGWQELDAKFRQDLPNDAYVGRLAYRGLVMRACPRIRMLDGVEVSEKERTKANHLLQGLEAGGKITAKAVAS